MSHLIKTYETNSTESELRCRLAVYPEQCNHCHEVLGHLATCPGLTSSSSPECRFHECGTGYQLPGMSYLLIIKTIGKDLKKCIDGVLKYLSPDVSTALERSSYDGSLKTTDDTTTVDSPACQRQFPSGLSPYKHNHPPLSFEDQNDFSSGLDCSPSQRPTPLLIPYKRLIGQMTQTSPVGLFDMGAPAMMSSPFSANSGETLSDQSSPFTAQSSSPGDPIYSASKQAAYLTTPITPHPSYMDFSSATEFVQATQHDDYDMSSPHGDMDSYGPYSGGILRDALPSSPFSEFSWGVAPQIDGSLDAMGSFGSDPIIDFAIHTTTGEQPSRDGNNSPRPDSQMCDESEIPHCLQCYWKPDPIPGKRNSKQLRQAVQKHTRRQHNGQTFICEVCNTPIKSRLDNFREHMRKKHPGHVSNTCPGSEGKRRQGENSSNKTLSTRQQKRRKSAPIYVSHEHAPQGPQGLRRNL